MMTREHAKVVLELEVERYLDLHYQGNVVMRDQIARQAMDLPLTIAEIKQAFRAADERIAALAR